MSAAGPARAWTWTSPPCRALELTAEVATDDPGLARHLTAALAPLTAEVGDKDQRITTTTSIRYTVAAADEQAGRRYVVTRDGERIAAARTGGAALDHLWWDLNRMTVAAARNRYLVLHAGAVARRGRAVLLPAPSGSGKTTLTAGLLAAGFDYLSDESPAIDPATLLVHPFHKPLSVEPGSSAVLAAFRSEGDDAPEPWRRARWVADPRARGASLSPPVPAAAVVVPAWCQGGPTRLEPMSPGEAVLVLAEQSFNFADRPRQHLEALGRLAGGCRSFRLPFGDLERAVALVNELADTIEAAA